jgi:hypothetical protein
MSIYYSKVTFRGHEYYQCRWSIKFVDYMYCVGLIPQPRSPTKCLWIEKSIKEGQGPIRTVEANGKKIIFINYTT